MQSTMQDAPLLISGIIRHGEYVYSEKKVLPSRPRASRRRRSFRSPSAPSNWPPPSRSSASQPGDRVATFMWNNQAHMEAYIAVPCMGAVLHTLNIRLFPEQLAFIINHAQD